MAVHQYRVASDGSVTEGPILITFPDGAGPGVPDGLKVDSAGNVWATAPGGIRIIAPDGKLLGQIKLPETAANLAWADGGKTLYVTAQTSVYPAEGRDSWSDAALSKVIKRDESFQQFELSVGYEAYEPHDECFLSIADACCTSGLLLRARTSDPRLQKYETLFRRESTRSGTAHDT